MSGNIIAIGTDQGSGGGTWPRETSSTEFGWVAVYIGVPSSSERPGGGPMTASNEAELAGETSEDGDFSESVPASVDCSCSLQGEHKEELNLPGLSFPVTVWFVPSCLEVFRPRMKRGAK